MEYCGPCKFRNSDRKADQICKTCQEFQCKECADVHRSSKATRTHLLIKTIELNESSKICQDMDKFQTCSDHSDKPCDFFCLNHSHLMCSTCLLHVQKSECKSIADITSAGESIADTFSPQVKKDLENVIAKCKHDEEKIKHAIQACRNEETCLSKYLTDTKEKVIKIFEKYETRVRGEIAENIEQQIATLDELYRKSTETREAAEHNNSMLKAVTASGSTADVFRCTLSITEQLDKVRKTSSNAAINVRKQIVSIAPTLTNFIEDQIPLIRRETDVYVLPLHTELKLETSRKTFFDSIKYLAVQDENEFASDEISTTTESYKPDSKANKTGRIAGITIQLASGDNTKSKETLEVKSNYEGKGSTSDSKCKTISDIKSKLGAVNSCETSIQVKPVSDIYITGPDEKAAVVEGVATLHDGRLVLSDSKGSRLIIYKENFTYHSQLVLTKQPGNIAVLDEASMAVCLQSTFKVALVSIEREFKWTKSIHTRYHPKGISTIDSNSLLISMRDGTGSWSIRVYSKEGKVVRNIKMISSTFDALHIASLNEGQSESERCFLQCCKKSNVLYCYMADGKEVFRYSIVSPSGLYVDFESNIYVLESYGIIHILSKDGKLITKTNLSFSTGINGITCNTKLDRLVITRNIGRSIRALSIIRK